MSANTPESIEMAKRLKKLRKERKLSHIKLSEALREKYNISISKDSLIAYEVTSATHDKACANQGMRAEYLRCLADFYDVSTDYLLGITNTKSNDTSVQKMVSLTGLSEQSIEYLAEMNNIRNRNAITPFIEETIEGELYNERLHLEAVLSDTTNDVPDEIQEIMDALNVSDWQNNKKLIIETALSQRREITAKNGAHFETIMIDAINHLIENEAEYKILQKIALYILSLPQTDKTNFRIRKIGLHQHFFPLDIDVISTSFLTEVDTGLKELRKNTNKEFDIYSL